MSFAVTNLSTSSTGVPNVNLQEVAGTTTSVNNGIADNGTLRVVIASDSSSIVVTQGTSPWVVSGTVTANIGTTGNLLTDAQLRASPVPISGSISFITPQHIILDSGTLTSITNVVHIDDNGGSLTVDNNGTFAVQAAQAGTWNIDNITGIISLPTGASTSANQTIINSSIQALQVTQGSTTSGQSGGLVLGAVTTVAPTYINGQTNALSLTTAGALRVDGSGVIQPVSGTVTALQGTSPWVVSGTITTSPDVNVHDGTGVSISSTGSSLNVNVTNTVPVSQSGTWILGANGGVDIGDVTINNAGGAAAVNIQDGGNSITVDGTVTVLQGTSPWVVSGTVAATLTYDTNYGIVGVNTLRTASQIGNSTGAADFNTGATGAQTLRVVANQGTSPWVVSGTVIANIGTTGGLALDSSLTTINTTLGTLLTDTQLRATPVPVSGTVTISNFPTIVDTNYGTVGANTIRTAAQIGNSTGAADFGAGITTAQTLRVVLPTDQTAIPVTQSEAWAVTLPYDTNYGTVGANTLRTAAQIGNATGAADFGAGATGAQTLRTSSNLSDGAGTALTSTLFNSDQSLDVRPNPGFSTGVNTRPAITNVSSTILASNVARRFAYIFNQTGTVIFLKFGATAVVNQGIRLPDNSMYEINADNLWTGDVMAVKVTAASVNVEVFEGTI